MISNYKKIEIVCDMNYGEIVELDEYDFINLAKLALDQSPDASVNEYIGCYIALNEYFKNNKEHQLLFPYKQISKSSEAIKILCACIELRDLAKCYASENVTLEEDKRYNYKSCLYDELLKENEKIVASMKSSFKRN